MTTRRTKARTKGAKKAARRTSSIIQAKIASGGITIAAKDTRRARAREKRGEAHDVGPTRERLAKADVHSADREHRVEDTLARLTRLQRLDATDKERNRELAKAGVIYQQAAHKAGLVGVSAQDLLRISGSADGGSDPKAVASRKVKRAHDLLGARLASAIHAILVDGHEIEEVGRQMTARKAERDHVVAGMMTLQNALGILSEKEAAWT